MGRGSLSRAVIAVSTVGHCRSHAPSPPRASPAKFASLFRVPFAKRRGGFLRHSRRSHHFLNRHRPAIVRKWYVGVFYWGWLNR